MTDRKNLFDTDAIEIAEELREGEPAEGLTITVKPGAIDVVAVQALVATKNVVVLSIDCRQKYPAIMGYLGSSGIILGASKRTLHVAPQKIGQYTEVSVGGMYTPDDMLLFGESARYGVLVTMVKMRESTTLLWESHKD